MVGTIDEVCFHTVTFKGGPQSDCKQSGCLTPAEMDAEAPGRSSRAAALRSFVAERLSAASREILAAVCTAVAAYEEEASGFREELHRQRKQLLELQRISETSVRNARNERGSPGSTNRSPWKHNLLLLKTFLTAYKIDLV